MNAFAKVTASLAALIAAIALLWIASSIHNGKKINVHTSKVEWR